MLVEWPLQNQLLLFIRLLRAKSSWIGWRFFRRQAPGSKVLAHLPGASKQHGFNPLLRQANGRQGSDLPSGHSLVVTQPKDGAVPLAVRAGGTVFQDAANFAKQDLLLHRFLAAMFGALGLRFSAIQPLIRFAS